MFHKNEIFSSAARYLRDLVRSQRRSCNPKMDIRMPSLAPGETPLGRLKFTAALHETTHASRYLIVAATDFQAGRFPSSPNLKPQNSPAQVITIILLDDDSRAEVAIQDPTRKSVLVFLSRCLFDSIVGNLGVNSNRHEVTLALNEAVKDWELQVTPLSPVTDPKTEARQAEARQAEARQAEARQAEARQAVSHLAGE